MTVNTSKFQFFTLCVMTTLIIFYPISGVVSADDYFSSEIKSITHDMLTPSYWQDPTNENKLFYSVKEIQ